jgi:hypothetical protein
MLRVADCTSWPLHCASVGLVTTVVCILGFAVLVWITNR